MLLGGSSLEPKQIPATHLGDLDGVPVSWLQDAGVLGNKPVDNRSVYVCVYV